MRALAGLPRTVWLLGAISLLNDAASDMIYPLVPLYLASVLLAGPRALGVIEGVAEAVSSLLKLCTGVLADRMRRTRVWILAGYGIAGAARPLIALATSWPGVLACRFADRVGKGLRSAPRDALLAQSVGPEQRGLAFGLHRAMDNGGAVLGPLAAAALLALGLSLRQVFLCAIVPAIVVMMLALRLREPSTSPSSTSPPSTRPALTGAPATGIAFDWRFAALPARYRRYLLALGLFTLGNSSNMFLLLRAQELGLGATRITLLWALYSAVAAVASTPLSALSDRLGRVPLIVAGWSAYAVLYLAMGLMDAGADGLWLAFGAYGLVSAAIEGSEKALVADLVPAARSGTAFGWYYLVAGLLLLPASVVFGALWHALGALAAFGFAAACAALASLLLLWGLGRDLQPAEETE